jgi:hypothetical protein
MREAWSTAIRERNRFGVLIATMQININAAAAAHSIFRRSVMRSSGPKLAEAIDIVFIRMPPDYGTTTPGKLAANGTRTSALSLTEIVS